MRLIKDTPAQILLGLSCLGLLADASCIPDHDKCKAYPGTVDWPSSKSWHHFNKTLDGQLLSPTPPGAVCHDDQPFYDADQCPKVNQTWTVFEFHTENPVSVFGDQFANYTCLPDPQTPCSSKGYPPFVVNATTAQHVKLGVDFARENNLRLIVKSTGHDYLGRSVAPGALSIWVHHLNSIVYHADQFQLADSKKTIPGNAITVGGGTQMYDIYKASAAHNQTVVGGGGRSVGVGGYVTGGGHSILAPRYGLAADNVLEMEVVTPAGHVLSVNEDVHSDLFWALRGGGGSTFGVVTAVTMATHPTPAILSTMWMIVVTPDSPIVFDLISFLLSQFPSLMDAGLSGYNFITTGSPNPVPVPGAPDEIAGMMGSVIVQDADSPDALDKIFKPLNDTIKEKWHGEAKLFQITTAYDSFLDWFNVNYDQGTAGTSAYLVSRLLDEQALTLDTDALKEAVKSASVQASGLQVFMVGGKGVQHAEPRGGGNAVNPGWRDSYVHALTAGEFPRFNATAEADKITELDESFDLIRKLSPHTGAYLNEALPFEKDWQHTFWGDNYERLLKIKRQVDPHDVFWCVPCVGNEGWEELDNGQLCKVGKPERSFDLL